MSRLAKTVVTEREDFVRSLFRENLRLTGLDIQNKLKEKFGKMMRPNRIYELKRETALEFLDTTTGTSIVLDSSGKQTTTTVTEAPTATIEVVEPLTAAEAAGTLGPTVDTVSTVG